MLNCADCGVALGIGIAIGAAIVLLLEKYFEWKDGRKIIKGEK
jgi:hypothetical protein